MLETVTITFHAPINNGAFLQAYALQRAVISLGYSNTILNYRSQAQKKLYRLIYFPLSIRDIGQNVYSLRHFWQLRLRQKRFERLRKDKLFLTKELDDYTSVSELIGAYSVLICGSDQIWNTTLPDYSDVYYLPGMRNKISYGVSLGKNCSPETLDRFSGYMSEFKAISVRDNKHAEMIRMVFGKDVKQVLDPTLLLNCSEWDLLSNPGIQGRDKYICFYSILYSEETLTTVSAVSKHLNLPVISPFGGNRSHAGKRAERHGIKVDYSAGPTEFLRYVKGAELVMTDSFHGTAFSIIFHKPFYQVQRIDSSGVYIPDDRIDCLLDLTGLLARRVNKKTIESVSTENQIDWKRVDARIELIRTDSLDWLKRSIQMTAETYLD